MTTLFEQLTFKPHNCIPNGTQAETQIGPYTVSIITGGYGTAAKPYEIGVFLDNDLQELPGITAEGDTVKGYLDASDVNSILKKIHLLAGPQAAKR